MSSVHPSQVPALVTDVGYAPMLESYAAVPNVRSSIFEMETVEGWELGFQGVVVSGPVVPSEIERGENAPARTMKEGFKRTFKIRKLAESMTLQEEMLRNPNATALVGAQVAEWLRRMGQGFQVAKEILAADVFNKGSLTAGYKPVFDGSYTAHADDYPAFIYDGKPLFAASGNGHPLFFEQTTTKYNQTANALSSTNLETGRVLMANTNAYNESNERINIDPNVLVVPPALSRTGAVLLNSSLLPGTAQNDTNTHQGQFQLIEWRYLSDAAGWFLGTRGEGLLCYDSGDPVISVSEPDKDNGNITIRLTSYHGVGVKDWRYWSAHNTPTS